LPRRREEKERERRSRPAAEGIWRRSTGGREGGRTHHVASLGGGSEKPLEKSPAARVPHSPPEVPGARERPGIRGARRRRRPPPCSLPLSLSLVGGVVGWLVSRATPDRGGVEGRPGQQWEERRAVGPTGGGGGRQARGRPVAGRGGGEGRRGRREREDGRGGEE